MDIRRSVNTRMWSDAFFEDLESKEKLLFVYLLTNEKTNMLGLYEISLKRISYETGLSLEDVRKAFEGFERVRKGYYLDGFVFLPNWIKNQAMNTNMMKSARTEFMSISNELILKLKGKGFEGFGSLSNPSVILPKKEEEKEEENEIENEIEKENEIENEIEKECKFPSTVFQNFMVLEKISNLECLEFLSSESWFETKAMQLKSEVDILTEKAKEFLIDVRDRDMLEGKSINDLRAHFVSWFKLNQKREKPASNQNYLKPYLTEIQ